MAASLWIALGGALGSLSRYWAGILMAGISRPLPWGTFCVNISGSFFIAFFGALTVAQSAGRLPVSENIRLFVMVGFCGGFTTFSTFSLQNFELLRNGAVARALLNMALSVLLCLAAAALGALCGEKLAGRPPQALAQAEAGTHREDIIRTISEDEA